MATATTQVKVNTSVGDIVTAMLAGDKAADSTWLACVALREKNRAAIEASTNKAVSAKVHQAVVESLTKKVNGDEPSVARVMKSAGFGAATVEQYWSQINAAEGLTGVNAKIVGREVHFEADGGTVRFVTRTDATTHNAVEKKAKKGEKHETTKGDTVQIWGVTKQADGTKRVSVVSTRAVVKPSAPAAGAQDAPVKSAAEEATETLAKLPKTITKALKGPDGKFYPQTDKERLAIAKMAKELLDSLAAQDGSHTDAVIKAAVGAAKVVRELPQVQEMLKK